MKAAKQPDSLLTFASTRFGGITVTEDKVITMAQGIPGFEKLRRYIMLDHDPEGVFKWLQAVDDPSIAFLLTDPNVYQPGYAVPSKKADFDLLGIKDRADLAVFVMVCVSHKDRRISLNLKAPILFNAANMSALQCIIDRDDYPVSFIVKI